MTSSSPWKKLYSTSRWSKLRELHLVQHPLCERCLDMEIVEPASVVHHRRAHKGSEALFFDPENLESMCKPHHDSHGRLEDNGKKVVRFGPDGWPI